MTIVRRGWTEVQDKRTGVEVQDERTGVKVLKWASLPPISSRTRPACLDTSSGSGHMEGVFLHA